MPVVKELDDARSYFHRQCALDFLQEMVTFLSAPSNSRQKFLSAEEDRSAIVFKLLSILDDTSCKLICYTRWRIEETVGGLSPEKAKCKFRELVMNPGMGSNAWSQLLVGRPSVPS